MSNIQSLLFFDFVFFLQFNIQKMCSKFKHAHETLQGLQDYNLISVLGFLVKQKHNIMLNVLF